MMQWRVKELEKLHDELDTAKEAFSNGEIDVHELRERFGKYKVSLGMLLWERSLDGI